MITYCGVMKSVSLVMAKTSSTFLIEKLALNIRREQSCFIYLWVIFERSFINVLYVNL